MSRPRQKPARPPARPGRAGASASRLEHFLFGVHTVGAAVENPSRRIRRLMLTENAARRLEPVLAARAIEPEIVQPRDLDRLLGAGTVHQGAAAEADPLASPALEELSRARLVLVLDQVTDPHNVGAILRSSAAFGVDALVMTTRHSPPLAGALAKAASGGLEHVAVCLVANLAQALRKLGDYGFSRIGLDGAAGEALESLDLRLPVALVLGAEDKGLRRLTRENCDSLCRLSTQGPIASLNVSNAAAVALHTVRMRAG